MAYCSDTAVSRGQQVLADGEWSFLVDHQTSEAVCSLVSSVEYFYLM